MPINSDARNVAKLALNEKVTSAMVACLEVIENELSSGESTHNESGTKSNLIKINLPTDGRKNIKEV